MLGYCAARADWNPSNILIDRWPKLHVFEDHLLVDALYGMTDKSFVVWGHREQNTVSQAIR